MNICFCNGRNKICDFMWFRFINAVKPEAFRLILARLIVSFCDVGI